MFESKTIGKNSESFFFFLRMAERNAEEETPDKTIKKRGRQY